MVCVVCCVMRDDVYFVMFPGNEIECSDSGDEVPPQTDQSDSSTVPQPPPPESTENGYSSGDLGDVSQACNTEHAQQSDQSDSGSATPTKPFSEMYKIPLLEKPMEQLSLSTDGTCGSGGVEPTPNLPSNEIVDKVVRTMWGYCHAYHVNNSVSGNC